VAWPALADEPGVPARWCAPELDTLGDDVCYALPAGDDEPPRELVIFLHGVIAPRGTWQWAQQRAAARASAVHRVAAIMPRGRRGLRTDSMKDWWTWPTGAVAQRAVEQQVLDSWWSAKRALEDRIGRPFARTYVFGFSNGAYYVSSLALRGRLEVDGYAAFAGGIAPKPIRAEPYAGVPRIPFYVGYGQHDTPAVRDASTLRRAFRVLDWPGKVVGRSRLGHVMTDSQVREALEFIRSATTEARSISSS
jgi:predicted esterase